MADTTHDTDDLDEILASALSELDFDSPAPAAASAAAPASEPSTASNAAAPELDTAALAAALAGGDDGGMPDEEAAQAFARAFAETHAALMGQLDAAKSADDGDAQSSDDAKADGSSSSADAGAGAAAPPNLFGNDAEMKAIFEKAFDGLGKQDAKAWSDMFNFAATQGASADSSDQTAPSSSGARPSSSSTSAPSIPSSTESTLSPSQPSTSSSSDALSSGGAAPAPAPVPPMSPADVLQSSIDQAAEKIAGQSVTQDDDAQAAVDAMRSLLGGDDETLQAMLSGLENMDANDPNAMDSLVESMMGSLMTKEVLYQPMQDICEKYPKWLEENELKISEEERSKYTKQYGVLQQIVEALDKEEGVEKITGLMTEMQEYGQPPAEIMNELLPGMGGGGDLESLFSQMPAMPGFPGMPGAAASGDDSQPPIPGLPDLSDPEKMREFQEQMKNFSGGDDQNCLIM